MRELKILIVKTKKLQSNLLKDKSIKQSDAYYEAVKRNDYPAMHFLFISKPEPYPEMIEWQNRWKQYLAEKEERENMSPYELKMYLRYLKRESQRSSLVG